MPIICPLTFRAEQILCTVQLMGVVLCTEHSFACRSIWPSDKQCRAWLRRFQPRAHLFFCGENTPALIIIEGCKCLTSTIHICASRETLLISRSMLGLPDHSLRGGHAYLYLVNVHILGLRFIRGSRVSTAPCAAMLAEGRVVWGGNALHTHFQAFCRNGGLVVERYQRGLTSTSRICASRETCLTGRPMLGLALAASAIRARSAAFSSSDSSSGRPSFLLLSFLSSSTNHGGKVMAHGAWPCHPEGHIHTMYTAKDLALALCAACALSVASLLFTHLLWQAQTPSLLTSVSSTQHSYGVCNSSCLLSPIGGRQIPCTCVLKV